MASIPDGQVRQAAAERRGRRERIRSKPGIGHTYRLGVFLAGLGFIALGLALAVLPGPLTIPPVLVGLWIWSTEFRFADRLFDSFKDKAREAWAHARRHPHRATAVTAGGLVAAGVAIWAASQYELVSRAQSVVGL